MSTNKEIGYSLRLDGKVAFWMGSDPSLTTWLRAFSRLLGAKQAQRPRRGPAMVFRERGKRALPGSTGPEWRRYDWSTIRIGHCAENEEYRIDLDNRCGLADVSNMNLALFPVFQSAIHSGGLPLHGALVRHRGTGILLAAPGGTGKSTAARRLPCSYTALCDDEALVLRAGRGRFNAHPLPTWSAVVQGETRRTWKVAESTPLRGIFFLERSRTDEAIPLGSGEGASRIADSSLQALARYLWKMPRQEQTEFRKRIFENACDAAKSIPVFKLRISLNGRFWLHMEQALSS